MELAFLCRGHVLQRILLISPFRTRVQKLFCGKLCVWRIESFWYSDKEGPTLPAEELKADSSATTARIAKKMQLPYGKLQELNKEVLGKWPTWRTILFYVFISILYMFRATSCSSSGESIVSIQHLVYVTLCRWPFRAQVGNFLSELHKKRSPTQSDINQMMYWNNWFSWWWTRGCSKHVDNWNKYIEKHCASSWSFTNNHNKMHGQQNIK